MLGRIRSYGVLSLSEAERGHEIFAKPHVLISITDPWALDAKLHPYPTRAEVLRLFFDDARAGDPDSLLFDEDLAAVVAGFVLRHDERLRLIVHCFAGMSRSAGMVAGLAEALGDEDVADECDRRYMPNGLVRRLTKEAVLTASDRRNA